MIHTSYYFNTNFLLMFHLNKILFNKDLIKGGVCGAWNQY